MFRRMIIAGVWAAALAAAPGFGADAYKAQATGPTGSIRGIVRLQGDNPPLPPNPVYKHITECGAAMPDERLVLGDGAALANVLVYVIDIAAGRPIDTGKTLVLDNRGCAFVPHVISASRGQTLAIRNSDPFLHDAHAWLGARTLFNVGLPKGKTVNKILDDLGLIQINCNVRHTWMRAYVFVADHPYHAVTDRDGRFVISELPPGTYTLRFWHELLGGTDRSATVTADSEVAMDLTLRAVASEDDGE